MKIRPGLMEIVEITTTNGHYVVEEDYEVIKEWLMDVGDQLREFRSAFADPTQVRYPPPVLLRRGHVVAVTIPAMLQRAAA